MLSCCFCPPDQVEISKRNIFEAAAEESTMASTSSSRASNSETSVHALLMRESKEDVFKKYETVEILGQGSMGYVSKVKVKTDMLGGSAFQAKINGPFPRIRGLFRKKKKEGNQSLHGIEAPTYALKMIQLDRISSVFVEELRNEIAILRTMDHPNIVKANEVYVYKKQIYIIMQACEGGDLYTRSPYSERGAARITAQILSAITYMHGHGIVHRDIKYENIMFESDEPDSQVKVIDFGLSKKFVDKPGVMTDRVGTVYTMAPQVLQGIYSSQADIWAIGVISYMLLSASKPFYHKRRRRLIDQIMRADFNFNAPVWEQISDDGKAFVSALLVIDPKVRLTAPQSTDHPWIVNRQILSHEVPTEEVLNAVGDCLVAYKETSQLKKIALNVIAHRSTSDEILQLRKAFETYDIRRDGIISFEEFKLAIEKMEYSDEDLQEIFESIDVNNNGRIMYTEFLAATIEAHGHIEERRIAEAFDRIDCDDSGFISKANLKEIMGNQMSNKKIDEMMKTADTDGDNKISYPEFLALFRKQNHALAEEAGNDAGSDEFTSSKSFDGSLVGLDAEIPGGRYDSNLDPSQRKQAEELKELSSLSVDL
mmetsp:Transcript_1637/g.2346  ORF Transcript_1637/g.2346 Transcript_1637/m.2346 type:complete len:597 (+) Transcript_1637:176-1966(+)